MNRVLKTILGKNIKSIANKLAVMENDIEENIADNLNDMAVVTDEITNLQDLRASIERENTIGKSILNKLTSF